MEYGPIDYRGWVLGDEARKGDNLRRLNILDSDEIRILKQAVPYLDARNDPGHTEFVVYSGIQLLNHHPGNREIVVAAAFIHDMGMYGLDPAVWKRFVETVKSNPDNSSEILRSEKVRRPHQNRSLLIGGRVLEKAGYFKNNPLEYWLEIADIVGDHDTRSLPTTINGKIVRAGDHLWRVSFPAMQIYFPDLPPEQAIKRMEEDTFQEPPFTLEGIDADIGKLELVNSTYYKFREKSELALMQKYPKELEKIASFYQ